MIFDIDQVDSLPDVERYDVCVAGGGVAGTVLAHSLAERGRRVLILEAGGLEWEEESQNVYQGVNVGRPYFDLDVSRLRFLGGTSNHWAGQCRPLDWYDLVKHDHIDGSGWPIGIGQIQPYLAPARRILELDPFPEEAALPSSDGNLKEAIFRLSPPVRFRDKYFEFLNSSETLDVFLKANLIKIDLDPGGDRIATFGFRGYRDDAPVLAATADHYVLALGGIENARALLNADHQIPTGLGNQADLVGRFFMEHVIAVVGHYVTDPDRSGLGQSDRFFSPTYRMIREAEIANCGLWLEPLPGESNKTFVEQVKYDVKELLCKSDIIADFVRSIRSFNCPMKTRVPVPIPAHAGVAAVAAEPIPNRHSRGPTDR